MIYVALRCHPYAGGVEGDPGWCHSHRFRVREVQGIGGYVRKNTVASQRFDPWVLHPQPSRFEIPPPNDSNDEESSSDNTIAVVV